MHPRAPANARVARRREYCGCEDHVSNSSSRAPERREQDSGARAVERLPSRSYRDEQHRVPSQGGRPGGGRTPSPSLRGGDPPPARAGRASDGGWLSRRASTADAVGRGAPEARREALRPLSVRRGRASGPGGRPYRHRCGPDARSPARPDRALRRRPPELPQAHARAISEQLVAAARARRVSAERSGPRRGTRVVALAHGVRGPCRSRAARRGLARAARGDHPR